MKENLKSASVILNEQQVSSLWKDIVRKFVLKNHITLSNALRDSPEKFWKENSIRRKFYEDFLETTKFTISGIDLDSGEDSERDISDIYIRNHFIYRTTNNFKYGYLNRIIFYITNKKIDFRDYIRPSKPISAFNNRKTNKKKTSENTSQSINFEIPNEFKIPIQQYFLFFKEYISISKRVNLKVEIKEHETGISINYENEENLEIDLWCQEYINFFRENLNNYIPTVEHININGEININDFKYLKVSLESQIANLKNSINILQLKNEFLLEENNYLKKLTLALAPKEVKIVNQIIGGGSQQFSDNIQNI